MELPYLKVEPEKALEIISECIVSGYQIKDEINKDYYANKDKVSELFSKWVGLANSWANETIEKIYTVFVSKKELYNFRDAPVEPLAMYKENADWFRIINQLNARIAMLNVYDKNIHARFHVNLTVARDLIIVNGDKGKIGITN